MRPGRPLEALPTPHEVVCAAFAFSVPVYLRRGVYRCEGCHAELPARWYS